MVAPVGVCAYEVDRSIDQPGVRASGTGDDLKVPVEHRDHALDDAMLEHQRASWRKTRHDSSFVGDHLRSSIPRWWPIYADLAFGATGVTAFPCVPARTRLDFDNHRTIEEPWPPPHGRYSPRRSWTQRSRCWRRRHVSVLRNAGLITSRGNGTWAYYTARRRPRCGSRSGATIVTSPARCPTGDRWTRFR